MCSKRAMLLPWRLCNTRSGSAHQICLTHVFGACANQPTAPGTAAISSKLPDSWACLCALGQCVEERALNNVVHSIMNGMHNSRTSCCQDQLLVHRHPKNMANALGKPFKTDQTFVAYKSLFALKPTCAEGSKLVLDRLACRH